MARFNPVAYEPEGDGYRIYTDDGSDTWMVLPEPPNLPRREPPPRLLEEGSGAVASLGAGGAPGYYEGEPSGGARGAGSSEPSSAPSPANPRPPAQRMAFADLPFGRLPPQPVDRRALENFAGPAVLPTFEELERLGLLEPTSFGGGPPPTPPSTSAAPTPMAPPPPSQVVRTPGGWQSGSRVMRPGLNETEDMQNARLGVRGVHERRAELAEERGRLESQQAAGVADIHARSNEGLAQLDEEERQASKNEKVLPLWQQEGNVGAKIAAGLAIALGGFGAAWARDGGPNLGLQAVNDAIDRDIASQEKNIKLSREARAQRRLKWLDRTKAMLDEYQARGLSDMAQLQAEELKAAIAGQLADQEYELAAARADQYLQQTDVYRPPGLHVVGGARGTPKPLDQGKLVPDGRGGQVLVKSDDEAKKLRGDYALVQSVEQDANEAIHALEAGKTNEFEAATKRLRGSLESLGIQSEELKSRWYWNDTASNKAAVEALKATAFRGYMNKLASQSAKPAVEGYRYDEHGRVQVDSALTGEAPQAVRPAQKTRK